MSKRSATSKKIARKKSSKKRISVVTRKALSPKRVATPTNKDRGKVSRQSSIRSGKTMKRKTEREERSNSNDDQDRKDSDSNGQLSSTGITPMLDPDPSVPKTTDSTGDESEDWEGSVSYTDEAKIAREEKDILNGSLKPKDVKFASNVDELREKGRVFDDLDVDSDW